MKNLKELIIEALEQLDVLDSSQWTSDGIPTVNAVNSLLPDDVLVNRNQITSAAPHFHRGNPVTSMEPKEEETLEPQQEIDYDFPVSITSAEMSEFVNSLEVKDLESAAAELTDLRQKVNSEIDNFRNFSSTVKGGISLINSRIKSLVPQVDNGQAIREYINSQNTARAERNSGTKRFMSPLDRAMAATGRRNGRQ